MSDTIKLIPRYVPLPTANIDDYIRQSFNTLFELLKRKKTTFPGINVSDGTTSALITLTECLHNNRMAPTTIQRQSTQLTKPLIPIQSTKQIGPNTISEGATKAYCIPKKGIPPNSTSEGVDTHQQKSCKPKALPMSDEEIQRILASIPKQKSQNKLPLPPPNVHTFYSLTPKTTNFKRTIGLPRFFPTNNNIHSKDGLLQTNHMFDLQGRRQSLDKLLAGA